MLRYLFYSAFDNKVGPQLPISVPHPFVTLKEFNEIDKYILPKKSLSHHLISFAWKSNIILNFPIRIEDSKYERHAFFFSFGMVLRRSDTHAQPSSIHWQSRTAEEHSDSVTRTKQPNIEIESYERTLKRLSLIFESLERDFSYLSHHNKHDHYPLHFRYLHHDNQHDQHSHTHPDAGQPLLRQILSDIFNGFKLHGECTVNLLQSRKIALKLCNKLSSPPQLRFHDVPVLLCDLKCIDHRWDIALQFVVKHIDSVNHIRRICDILRAKLNDVDNHAVLECVRQLLYYKYVVITDVFQYSNLYIASKNVAHFMHSRALQQSVLVFVDLCDADDLEDDEEEKVANDDDDDHDDNGNNIDGHGGNGAVETMMMNGNFKQYLHHNGAHHQQQEDEEEEEEESECEDIDGDGGGVNRAQRMQMVKQLYAMYNAFDGKHTVKELMHKNGWKQNALLRPLDVHRFVLFGTVHKLIRRIHRYPVVIHAASATQPTPQNVDTQIVEKLKQFCDGTHCLDEICCELSMNHKEVEKLLKSFDDHVVLHK